MIYKKPQKNVQRFFHFDEEFVKFYLSERFNIDLARQLDHQGSVLMRAVLLASRVVINYNGLFVNSEGSVFFSRCYRWNLALQNRWSSMQRL